MSAITSLGSEYATHDVAPGATRPEPARQPSWTERYGDRHRLVRIDAFPPGITGPKKVRVYYRHDHYVLQWWDPAAKANLSDRVEGDLVAAIMRSRQIEERLTSFRRSGLGGRRLGHAELVERFLADLERRANAGAVDPATRRRYGSALVHYTAFVDRIDIRKAFPTVSGSGRYRPGEGNVLVAEIVECQRAVSW